MSRSVASDPSEAGLRPWGLGAFIVAVFCLVDDRPEDQRFLTRCPKPKPSDSEVVLTIETIGKFIGIEGLFDYFRQRAGLSPLRFSELLLTKPAHRVGMVQKRIDSWCKRKGRNVPSA